MNAQNTTVKLTNVRLSYPHLFSPNTNNKSDDPNAKPKYEATFILDKTANAKDIQAIKAAIEVVKKDPKMGGKKPNKVCLRDGADTETRAEAEGLGPQKMTVGARSVKRPAVVNRDLTPIAEDDNIIYAGCYVNATIDVYPYTHPKSGAGVGASLRAVQFLKDGESLGGGAPIDPSKEFTAIEEEAVV